MSLKNNQEFLIGAHTSTAGGYFRAAELAGEFDMRTFQLFTKNNNQWKAKPILAEEAEKFVEAVERYRLVRPIAHTSYLINLASPNPELYEKSIAALVEELRRAELLKLDGLVMHPGSATDNDELAGLKRIADGIRIAMDQAAPTRVHLLLENTAGQGSALGWKFEHLSSIHRQLANSKFVGFCLDSCHAHAAGYDLSQSDELIRLVAEAERWRILDSIEAIHLNDSKKGAGSRVDRHEHLGKGTITSTGLKAFISHPAFRSLPMYLETEKGQNENGEDWDAINLRVARQLFSESQLSDSTA
jgi:deoxyribonuclease IV